MGCLVDKIDKIESSGIQETYDIEIEPLYLNRGQYKETEYGRKKKYNNLYFLLNGIWTHNCKRNCLPSSAKDRFTNDFEYFIFLPKRESIILNNSLNR
jgi:hypothetical protein